MENYEDFKKFYFELSHINLNAYKEKQMKRRIETLITRKGLASFVEYAERLKSDKTEQETFKDYITINVTEFFRTPEHWKFLESQLIPMLEEMAGAYPTAAEISKAGAAARLALPEDFSVGKLNIWSAGCSTGEEPYSLSMLLLNYFSPSQFKILATDIDESVLQKAKRGVFDQKSMETIPEEYSQFKEKYFEQCNSVMQAENQPNLVEQSKYQFSHFKQEKAQFKISENVKEQIEFQKLDMTLDVFPQNCDLIVCRNVLIYFTEETKQIIFKKFVESLKSGGILFLGHTEQIVYYKNFGLEKLAKNFYRKK